MREKKKIEAHYQVFHVEHLSQPEDEEKKTIEAPWQVREHFLG
jgi:hypothetical protein